MKAALPFAPLLSAFSTRRPSPEERGSAVNGREHAQMSGLPKKEECVRVVVRCRPMSRKETEDNRQKVVEMDKHRGCVRDRCLRCCAFTHHHACLWCGR